MFLEIYAKKRSDCNPETVLRKESGNLHLFEMSRIHVRHSKQFPEQAEIITPDSETYLAVESYETVRDRIAKVTEIVREVK